MPGLTLVNWSGLNASWPDAQTKIAHACPDRHVSDLASASSDVRTRAPSMPIDPPSISNIHTLDPV